MCSSLGDNLICSPCLERDVDGGWRVVAGSLSRKASMLYLNFDLAKVVKKHFKTRGRGCWFSSLVLFFCPVELGSLELTGAQPFFLFLFYPEEHVLVFFWGFFLKGDALRRDLYHYVCLCVWDGSHYTFFSSLFSEWGGFAHFKTGWGCKYLSLAQWIKDAFCPVGVTICLTRWINYCTSKQRERRKKKRNAKTQHAVRSRYLSCGDWMLC